MNLYRYFFIVTIIGLLLMVNLTSANDLNGTWKGRQVQGEPGNWTFIFKDSSLVVYGPNPGEYFKLEAKVVKGKEKPQIKAVFKDASDPTVINMETTAIYKFEDEKLVIAASEPGYGGPPSSFDATWGVFVFELKKDTKAK